MFSIAGAIWFFIAAGIASRLTLPRVLLILLAGGALAILSVQTGNRGRSAAKHAHSEQERRSAERTYWIVNAITWASVLIAINVLNNIGHKDWSMPAFVIIVGAHLFFMPALYRSLSKILIGICLIVWAVLAVLLFRPSLSSEAATLGAGFILWISALLALLTARKALRAYL